MPFYDDLVKNYYDLYVNRRKRHGGGITKRVSYNLPSTPGFTPETSMTNVNHTPLDVDKMNTWNQAQQLISLGMSAQEALDRVATQKKIWEVQSKPTFGSQLADTDKWKAQQLLGRSYGAIDYTPQQLEYLEQKRGKETLGALNMAIQAPLWALDPVGMALFEGANAAPAFFDTQGRDASTQLYEDYDVNPLVAGLFVGGAGGGIRGLNRAVGKGVKSASRLAGENMGALRFNTDPVNKASGARMPYTWEKFTANGPVYESGFNPMDYGYTNPLGLNFRPQYRPITAKNASVIIDAEWDAAFNAAIKAGDMAEAQRLRDLQFKYKALNFDKNDIRYQIADDLGNSIFGVVNYPVVMDRNAIEKILNSNSADDILNGDVLNDFQFEQIFGVNKKDFLGKIAKDNQYAINLMKNMRNLSNSKIEDMIKNWAHRELVQKADFFDSLLKDKDIVSKTRKEASKNYIIGDGYESNNMKTGNFPHGDIRKAFKRIYKLLESPEYRQRWINDGYKPEEADKFISLQKKFMEKVSKAKVNSHILNPDTPIFIETTGASGIYHHPSNGIYMSGSNPEYSGMVEVISKSLNLSDEELSTFIHELIHASDSAAPEVYMKKVKWMKPLETSIDKDYYSAPTEQRARAIATLVDMHKKRIPIDKIEEYDKLPKHDHNYDDMIRNYGKEQTFEFMKAIYGLIPAVILTNIYKDVQ